MTKRFLTFGILAIVLMGGFVPSVAFGVACTAEQLAAGGQTQTFSAGTGGAATVCNMPAQPGQSNSVIGAGVSYVFGIVADSLFKGISIVLMTLSAGILTLAGELFDFIVKFTIIDMTKNIGDPEGVGGSISTAWATLRDIANMAFIFVLLYAAFKAMFELNFGGVGTTIRNIIIVALLINFSLFFSKVVIDASNIVSVGFYNSIITTNVDSGGVGPSSGQTISTGYMRLLGLQSWHSPNILGTDLPPGKLLVVGIMSSIFMLVTAVILLISGIMFLARFIILIFLMILSPLALIAYIIPGMKGQFDKWKDALIDQSFFAPLFFALTWVVFKLANNPNFLGQSRGFLSQGGAQWVDTITKAPTPSSMGLILNYVLVMGFAIAALIFSKQMASKTAGFKAISGGIGAAGIGGAALAGRNVIGRGSKMLADSSGLKNAASSGKWYSKAAQAGLWTANKGGKASYDARGLADTKLGKATGVGETMGIAGKAGGVGGFAKAVDDKAKAKAQYAKEVYGQTDAEKEAYAKAQKLEEEDVVDEKGNVTKKGIRTIRAETAAKTKTEANSAENARKTYIRDALKPEQDDYETTKRDAVDKKREISLESDIDKKKVLQGELDSINTRMTNERTIIDEKKKDIEENDQTYKKLRETDNEKRTAAQEAETQRKKKEIGDEEYSKETQAMNKVGEERQEAYAKRLENSRLGQAGQAVALGGLGAVVGGVVAGPIGAAVGAAITAGVTAYTKRSAEGDKASARKVRAEKKGKSKKDKLADLAAEVAAEDKKAKESGETTAPPAPPPPPPPSPPPTIT